MIFFCHRHCEIKHCLSSAFLLPQMFAKAPTVTFDTEWPDGQHSLIYIASSFLSVFWKQVKKLILPALLLKWLEFLELFRDFKMILGNWNASETKDVWCQSFYARCWFGRLLSQTFKNSVTGVPGMLSLQCSELNLQQRDYCGPVD